MKITNGVLTEQRLAVCRLNGKYGIVNSEGKQIQPMAFDELRKDVSDPSSKELPDMGSARDLHVRIGDKWGVLTADGEQLAEVKFDSVGVFHDGFGGGEGGGTLRLHRPEWGDCDSYSVDGCLRFLRRLGSTAC